MIRISTIPVVFILKKIVTHSKDAVVWMALLQLTVSDAFFCKGCGLAYSGGAFQNCIFYALWYPWKPNLRMKVILKSERGLLIILVLEELWNWK